MDRDAQIDHLEEEIEKVIARFRHEYDVPYASIVGVLHIKAYELSKEAFDIGAEEEKD